MLNERIKELRLYLGLSQAKFARRIHKSPGLISNIETNACDVSEDTVDAVCSAFPVVNKVWLRTGEGTITRSGEDGAPADKAGMGSRLKQIRKDAGLTQVQFAEMLGYTQAHVQMTEAGRTIPSEGYIERVMMEFRISEQWLMTGVGEKKIEDVHVDAELIAWLEENPRVIMDLWRQSGRV